MSEASRPLPHKIYIGIPTADGTVDRRHHRALRAAESVFEGFVVAHSVSSAICFNFNMLFSAALNARPHGFDRFLLLHDDVVPDSSICPTWLANLEAERVAHGLDVISVVIPIKSDLNDTTTGIDMATPGELRKFKVDDLAGRTVTNDTTPGLLINTGCLLMDLSRPWCEEFYFSFHDTIGRRPDGKFEARMAPEDWHMSRWFRERGIRFGATSKIPVIHVGNRDYRNKTEVHPAIVAVAPPAVAAVPAASADVPCV